MVKSKGQIYVKENTLPQAPLSHWWLVLALLVSGLSLVLISLIDHALPEPLTRNAPPDRFIGEIAHEHLVNLTSIGPRVAGSYENEVLGVGVIVEAVKRIAANASPHHRIELDLHLASGAFPLEFLDGMNNIYKDVSSVVVRLSAAGEKPARSALLLNCHFDSVPDSPGASDDGAGCAVMLETLRALSSSSAPLRHDALFLLNGAEENILQASHGFVTRHPWAGAARAFINVEACGAGGREVLFQAGPHDPWLVEQYAAAAPHPFASSLAQELFQSGLIPADTDFRIFRDFGGMSGVDFAWSSNGYVYHTLLDTAERVSAAVLQRTGDNVLALARGVLSSEFLDSARDRAARQPVFFDVLGVAVVSVRAPAALLALAVTLLIVVADLRVNAREAAAKLGIKERVWWRCVLGGAGAVVGAAGAGLGAAAASGLAAWALGASLAWYSSPALLAPLFAAPALAAAAAAGAALAPAPPGGARGWWRARAVHHGTVLVATGLTVVAALGGVRSGFLPLLWAGLPALADLCASAAGRAGGAGRAARGAWWAGGALPVALETWYLAVGSLRMFVPVAGRAGPAVGPLPPDVVMGVLVALLSMTACSWLLPIAVATRNRHRLSWVAGACWALSLCVALLVAPYSGGAPQRLMVFHTRRTAHSRAGHSVDHRYWVPELDANTARTLDAFVPGASPVTREECDNFVYCGAPYYLPVLALLPASRWAPAPMRKPTTDFKITLQPDNTRAKLTIEAVGAPHTVIVVSPSVNVRLTHCNLLDEPLRAAPWGDRDVYFFALFRGRGNEPWRLELQLEREGESPQSEGEINSSWAQISAAGHHLFGDDKWEEGHAELLQSLPDWIAPTGWGVDLHLYEV